MEGTYRTGHQEHVYIEPNGVIAVPESGGVVVYGSLQCPFYVHKALKSLLGDHAHVRVVQTETGGAFRGFGAPRTKRVHAHRRTAGGTHSWAIPLGTRARILGSAEPAGPPPRIELTNA